MKRAVAAILGVIVGLTLLAAGTWMLARGDTELPRPGILRPVDPAEFEREARAYFERRYPGEKPLNWRIAETAERFLHERPMGRFVLHENDCSDFVGCVIDEALGPGARFNRDSDEHVLCGEGGRLERWLFDRRRLPDVGAVQPGDTVHVRHSPWYAPYDDSIGHVGVVGPNGGVIDFSKLISWPEARYQQTDFDFFVRHNRPEQVVIGRLRPEFRYRLSEITWDEDG